MKKNTVTVPIIRLFIELIAQFITSMGPIHLYVVLIYNTKISTLVEGRWKWFQMGWKHHISPEYLFPWFISKFVLLIKLQKNHFGTWGPETFWWQQELQTYLWNGKDSALAKWLKRGADGARLDVASEIGRGSPRMVVKS